MDKDYIEIKIPILDSVDGMKVVETFTKEQLWYVCAIVKAFEKSEQQVKKQKEVIDKAIEFTNKKWGTWCTHHIEYMTELQNILKEGKK